MKDFREENENADDYFAPSRDSLSTIFQSRFSSLDRPLHCCSSDLAAENDGSPRIRTELRGLRDRRFASKLATQKTTATRTPVPARESQTWLRRFNSAFVSRIHFGLQTLVAM